MADAVARPRYEDLLVIKQLLTADKTASSSR